MAVAPIEAMRWLGMVLAMPLVAGCGDHITIVHQPDVTDGWKREDVPPSCYQDLDYTPQLELFFSYDEQGLSTETQSFTDGVPVPDGTFSSHGFSVGGCLDEDDYNCIVASDDGGIVADDPSTWETWHGTISYQNDLGQVLNGEGVHIVLEEVHPLAQPVIGYFEGDMYGINSDALAFVRGEFLVCHSRAPY